MPICTHCGAENALYAMRCHKCREPILAPGEEPISIDRQNRQNWIWSLAGSGAFLVGIVAMMLSGGHEGSSTPATTYSYPHATETMPAPVKTSPPVHTPLPPALAESSDEYKLAMINHGGWIAPDDPDVARAKHLLEYIEARVPNTRQEILDMSVAATNEAAKRGKTIKVLDLMEQAKLSFPTDSSAAEVKKLGLDYGEIVSILVLFMLAEE